MGLFCDLIGLTDQEITKCETMTTVDIFTWVKNNQSEYWTDIDKAWHGLHYLLTQDGGERGLDFLLVGGKKLNSIEWDDIDNIRIPDLRAFSSDQLLHIHQRISEITEPMLCARYQPQKMMAAKIYPEIWKNNQGLLSTVLFQVFNVAPQRDYLLIQFRNLKKFLAKASSNNLGMLVKYH